MIDLNSSAVGQYSWYTRAVGGWFTYTFQRHLSGSPEWPKFLADLSDASNTFFKQQRAKFVGTLPAGAPLDAIDKRSRTRRP